MSGVVLLAGLCVFEGSVKGLVCSGRATPNLNRDVVACLFVTRRDGSPECGEVFRPRGPAPLREKRGRGSHQAGGGPRLVRTSRA